MGAGDEALQDYSSLNGVILIPRVQHYTQQSSFSFEQKELNKDGEDFGHTFKFYFFALIIHFLIFPICFPVPSVSLIPLLQSLDFFSRYFKVSFIASLFSPFPSPNFFNQE